MTKNKYFPLILVLIAALIGGAIVPAIKVGLKTIPPMSFTFLRFFIAGLCLLPLLRWEKPDFSSVKEVIYPSILSSINIILFIYAVRFMPANIGQLVYVTTPIMVSILSFVILKERVSFYKALGIALGFAGAIYLLVFKTIEGFNFKGNYLGFFMIVIGAFLYSFYLVTTKNLQKKYSPLYITTVFNGTTAVIALIFSIGELWTLPVWILGLNLTSIAILVYVAVFGTAAFYLIGQYVVKHASPTLSAVIQYVQIPFTIVFAMLLLGERVTIHFFIAAAMIIFAAYLASK